MGFRGGGGNGYTLGYGFGSIRSCAGNWSSFSCEDDGVGGGCRDSPESFGWEGEAGYGKWTSDGFEFDDGRENSGLRDTAGAECRADDGAGAADWARTEGGRQAIWRGGVGPVREAVGGVVA